MFQSMLESSHLDVLDDLTTSWNTLRNPKSEIFKEVRIVGMCLTLSLRVQIHHNVASCPIGRMPLLLLSSARCASRVREA